jgi:hypothetical protein
VSDMERLLDSGADDFELRILSAGRLDRPTATSRRRILTGLGVGGALGATLLASTMNAGGWFGNLSRALLLRSAMAATVGAAAVIGYVQLTPSAPAPHEPAAVVAPRAPAAPKAVVPAAPVEVPEQPAPEIASPAPEAASPTPAPVSNNVQRSSRSVEAAQKPGLSDELGSLDRARQALVAGDAGRSLRLLDDYHRRFPQPKLGTEAAVLRIEALAASGQRARASELGAKFLARHGKGPYGARVRSLIGESKSKAAE